MTKPLMVVSDCVQEGKSHTRILCEINLLTLDYDLEKHEKQQIKEVD